MGKNYNISNVGAILFARNVEDFSHLARKALRIIVYQGDSRVKTIREHKMNKGYAILIKEAIEANRIKQYDRGASKKYMKYIPRWA